MMNSLLIGLAAMVFAKAPSLDKVICESTNTAIINVTQVHTDEPFEVSEFGRQVIVDADIEQMIHGTWQRRSFKGETIKQLRFLAHIDLGMHFSAGERYLMNYAHQSNGVKFYDIGGAWLIEDGQIVSRRVSVQTFIEKIKALREQCLNPQDRAQ